MGFFNWVKLLSDFAKKYSVFLCEFAKKNFQRTILRFRKGLCAFAKAFAKAQRCHIFLSECAKKKVLCAFAEKNLTLCKCAKVFVNTQSENLSVRAYSTCIAHHKALNILYRVYWSAGDCICCLLIALLEGASFVLFVKLVVLVYVAMLKAYP